MERTERPPVLRATFLAILFGIMFASTNAQSDGLIFGEQWADMLNSSASLPAPLLPTPAGEFVYDGQPARMSQVVRTNGAGELLFFAIDGNIYDGAGYLIADALGDECQECLHPGEMEMHAVPVPGSCYLFYLITSNAGTALINSRVQVSILDLTATNSYSTEGRGRLLALAEGEAATLYPQFGSFEVILAGNANGSSVPAWISGSSQGKALAPMIRIIDPTGTGDSFWMYLILTDRVMPYRITSNGIAPVPTAGNAGIPTFEVDGDPFTYKSLSRDADVLIGPNGEVMLAMTDEAMWVRTVNPPTGPYQLMIMRFDAVTGALAEVTGHAFDGSDPLLPDFFRANSQIPPPVQTITGNKGCALIAGGNSVLMTGVRETATNWEPTIGVYDLNTNGWTDLIAQCAITQPVNYVHTRLYRNSIGVTNEPAVFIPLANGLAAFQGTDQPGTMTFNPSLTIAPTVEIPQYDPLVFPMAEVETFPRFLNAQISIDVFAQNFAAVTEGECCIFREAYGGRPGYTHSGSATWTASNNPFGNQAEVNFTQNVVIPNGTAVYVTGMTWRFAENARLIVKRGGYIKFTNSTLTSLACVGTRWPGSDVQGSWNQDQSGPTPLNHPTNQGMMELVNSTIENAAIGVLVGARSTNGSIVSGSGGGVITTSNSTFLNCAQGVDMRRYPFSFFTVAPITVPNRSRFSKTTFTVDAGMGPWTFKAHARLDNVHGIRFQQCTFKNLRENQPGSHALGYGIHSFQSEFKVLPVCNVPLSFGQTCPAANSLPSKFIGLDHGIHAMGGPSALRNFTVDRAVFTDNICGVYSSGVIGFIAKGNTFSIGGRNVTLTNLPDELNWQSHHRGIYSYNGYGFTVDDNILTKTATSAPDRLTEGIVIGYSKDHNDYVFRNTGSNLANGFVGEGVCASLAASYTPTIGLQLICNTNNNNDKNLWSRKVTTTTDPNEPSTHTIRSNQGYSNRPADNTFDGWNGTGDKWDFRVTTTYSPISYWHRNVGNYVPQNNAALNPLMNPEAVTSIPENNCAFKVPRLHGFQTGPVATTAEMADFVQDEKLAYGNLRWLYDQLLDGGSTDEVVQEITDAWPQDAWDLLAYLLGKSPTLTTSVLKDLKVSGKLPQAMFVQVCIANPDATKAEGFVKWLEYEAPDPVPDYLIASIEASWEVKTYRTDLEFAMGDRHAAMSQASNMLIEEYSRDTVHDPTDSLRMVWQEVRTPAARYAEAIALMQRGDFVAAKALVQAIPAEHTKLREKEISEQERMVLLIGFMQTLAATGRTDAELTVAEQDQLEAIIADASDRSANWAQNLLCFHYNKCRAPLTGGEAETPKSRNTNTTAFAVAAPLITVFPNPTSTWATVNIALAGVAVQASLRIVDLAGKTVQQQTLNALLQQVVLDTRKLAPGAYLVELLNNNKVLATEKLIVQP